MDCSQTHCQAKTFFSQQGDSAGASKWKDWVGRDRSSHDKKSYSNCVAGSDEQLALDSGLEIKNRLKLWGGFGLALLWGIIRQRT